MSKPAVYLRVSSEIQKERESIKSQEDALRLWLTTQGLDPERDVIWYRDDGISGKTPIMERGDGARLVEDVKSGAIGGFVAVFSISRISRETADFFAFRTLLRQHQIALLGVSEGIDTRTDAGDFVAGVHALLADEAHRNLRKASMAGLKRKAKEGKWIARPPYGYTLSNGDLLIEEDTAAIVRDIFRLYLGGKGARQIATHFNRLGILSPGKAKWQTNIVLRILHNPVYMGQGRWNVTEMSLGRRTGRKRPEAEHIIIATPAIVKPAEWRQAQRLLEQGAKRFEKTGLAATGTLLTRVRCMLCGRRYYRAKAPKGAFYYRHDAYHPGECESENIPAVVLDQIVWERVYKAIQNPYLWLDEMAARRNNGQVGEDVQRDLQQVIAALDRNAKALDRLEDMALYGDMDIERYSHRAKELGEERIGLKTRQHELEAELEQRRNRATQEQSLAAEMEEYRDAIDTADFYEKQRILDRFLSVVRAKRSGTQIDVQVEWR